MTLIEFHTGAPDKLEYACRLLRKACAGGKTVLVTGEADSIATLDALLWRFSASSFVAHCRETASSATLAASPVVLVASPAGDTLVKDVLVNVGQGLPTGFERFERLIEIVGSPQPDIMAGRARWKEYVRLGFTPTPKAVREQAGAA